MDASWFRNKTEKDNPILHEKANSMIESVNETIKTVRRIATELRPGILDDLGLVAAIEWQMEEFKRKSKVSCKIEINCQQDSFERNISTAFFRIFQESLTNIARHSQATQVLTQLYEMDQQLVLKIKDNGIGITKERLNNTTSLGLLGMKERANMLGGNLSIIGLAEGGTEVTLKIPIEK
jgi:signal transduction histidine kinase